MRRSIRQDGAVGFWGHFLVARSSHELPELPAVVNQVGEQLVAWRAGDWTISQCSGAEAFDGLELVRALAVSTGAPALVADVQDSDNAVIHGIVPGGDPWWAALRPECMREYVEFHGDSYDEHFPLSPQDAVRLAVDWAHAADLTPDEPAVARDFVEERADFVEDLFFTLLEDLGLPESTLLGPADPG
jgi:hypothetical protein